MTVQSVEMRDVVIPNALHDAMSREAPAAREKQAGVTLSELLILGRYRFQLSVPAERRY